MANSRISDLNKILSLDPSNDVQGSGMFLVANKKVGCEHIEYRDLKKTITDHTVFTTGDQLNIMGNKTFKGTVTFEGGHTDGSTGPLSDLANDLFSTGQLLTNALTALDLDHDADSIKTNLFNTGQLLYNKAVSNSAFEVSLFATGQSLNQKILSETQARVAANNAAAISLFNTGQLLASRHEVDTLTAETAIKSPLISGTIIEASASELSITGKEVNISGADKFSISEFNSVTVNSSEDLNTSSSIINNTATTNYNISSPVVTIGEDVFIKGDLFVSGETVTFDVGTLSIEDKTIELAVSTTGADGTAATAETNDATADGAGLIVKSSEGDKTWLWEKDTLSWESNQIISAEGSLIIKNPTLPPVESNAAEGEIGEMRWDDNFLYIKTTNGWRRALLMDWGA